MDDHEPSKKFSDHFDYEVSPSVNYYFKWPAELTYDMYVCKPCGVGGIHIWNGSCVNPLCKVVDSNYYITKLGPVCSWFNGIDIMKNTFFKKHLG